MNNYRALVVDDEPDICELLEITLQRLGVVSHIAGTLSEAKVLLTRHKFDVCLTDMQLPDGNGLELIELICQDYETLPVAMITAHGNVASAVQALKLGAFDFVSKPVDLQNLRTMILSALKTNEVDSVEKTNDLVLLGESAVMAETRATILKLAKSQAPVYISGESGSGKELVARMIHNSGPRSNEAFVPVNCGAIPEQLMESEFFGYKKGSFTGATSDKEGLFQAASGGTLFLDEIADLPMHMQVKLLRVMQEKAVRPVGASKELPVNVRILSATHKNLSVLVDDGLFRQDLFYRVNVIELPVPSLRAHPDDIPLLVDSLLTKLSAEVGESKPIVSAEAMSSLCEYAFPGNVRELENILERAMTLCEAGAIQASDLKLPDCNERDDASHHAMNLPLDPYLDGMEKEAIKQALEKTRHNKTAAAKLLGISFRQLRYRMQKMEME